MGVGVRVLQVGAILKKQLYLCGCECAVQNMHALWVATSIAHRESVYVHVYLKERENEGESGRKIGTEPESFFFLPSR